MYGKTLEMAGDFEMAIIVLEKAKNFKSNSIL
jgi:hypothetical protein